MPLRIGPLTFDLPFAQAALSGYSDAPMRRIARRKGAVYALAEVVIDRFAVEAQSSSWVRRHLTIADDDHPIGGQLMGSEPTQFQFAAKRLIQAGYDVIDINFGCPVKSAIGGCRGGYHLGQPEAALEIVQRVREVVPPEIPVTVKMRRGIDGTDESRDRCFRILEGAFALGVAAVTLHGRTVEQKYVGPSRWEFLREAKAAFPNRTLLGSGDLFTAEDCVRMLSETGVDGLSVARGAIGNPWIFREVAARLRGEPELAPPTILEQAQVIREHLALAQEVYDEATLLGRMRKHLVKYARLHPDHEQVRNSFAKVGKLVEIHAILDEQYSQLPNLVPGAARPQDATALPAP